MLLRDDVTISEVVIRRLGLFGLPREGREAIGLSLGIPGADVWFAEREGFSRVQKFFSEGQAGRCSLHSELQAFAEQVRRAVRQAPRRDVVSLEDFQWALAGLMGTSPSLEDGIMPFFLDWCELQIDRYDERRVFVYRDQNADSRALFKLHLTRVEREWKRGLRGPALAKSCPLILRGLSVTLGQVLHLLEVQEERPLAEAS